MAEAQAQLTADFRAYAQYKADMQRQKRAKGMENFTPEQVKQQMEQEELKVQAAIRQ